MYNSLCLSIRNSGNGKQRTWTRSSIIPWCCPPSNNNPSARVEAKIQCFFPWQRRPRGREALATASKCLRSSLFDRQGSLVIEGSGKSPRPHASPLPTSSSSLHRPFPLLFSFLLFFLFLSLLCQDCPGRLSSHFSAFNYIKCLC